ncbi:uncharacterized protein ACOB8E_023463 isoform 2-T2 [Sarcophilus harrisii]
MKHLCPEKEILSLFTAYGIPQAKWNDTLLSSSKNYAEHGTGSWVLGLARESLNYRKQPGSRAIPRDNREEHRKLPAG